MIPFLLLALHLAATCLVVLRIMLRDDIAPNTRVAWVLLLLVLPVTGLLLYFLFGEVRLSRRFLKRHREVTKIMKRPQLSPATLERGTAFAFATSINGFPGLPGNKAELMSDGDEARRRLISDIEVARDHVHILYYIWLGDHTGINTAQAVIGAARRGVRCRVMADALGSRAFIGSQYWEAMREAGVEVVAALPLPTIRTLLTGNRLDLRNHRKITIIDGRTCYCGSQNCADAAFLPKARFAPWVDIMLRFEGPVVRQMQVLFAQGWLTERPDSPIDFNDFEENMEVGFDAQVVGTGPTVEHGTTAQLFTKLISQARQELVISTPYFVPDETVASALCAAAASGVEVTLVLPRRNDSRFVALASRSHYKRLLGSGVRIYEFQSGLLHAKTLTVDGQITFLGSSNMDLRSFDLNFENDILLRDASITGQVRQRQMAYIADSVEIDEAQVQAWSRRRRLAQNACATMSPIL